MIYHSNQVNLMDYKIIVALDTNNLKKAKKLIKTLWLRVKFFKIGLELINTGKAPELIKYINKLGGKVFYDIKLNDIPNTVGRTVKVISRLGVWGFTIHALAGQEAIRAAVHNKGRSKVIGVTILTSSSASVSKILQLVRILAKEGVDGVVCSAREASVVKRFGLKIITPGIRPKWAQKNDQKRTAIPKEAITAGSDYLIIGRPITDSANPLEALIKITEEIET